MDETSAEEGILIRKNKAATKIKDELNQGGIIDRAPEEPETDSFFPTEI